MITRTRRPIRPKTTWTAPRIRTARLMPSTVIDWTEKGPLHVQGIIILKHTSYFQLLYATHTPTTTPPAPPHPPPPPPKHTHTHDIWNGKTRAMYYVCINYHRNSNLILFWQSPFSRQLAIPTSECLFSICGWNDISKYCKHQSTLPEHQTPRCIIEEVVYEK